MKKTITELSNELSISRQAVHQAIDKLIDKDKIEKKGNKFVLDNVQEKVLKEFFEKKSTNSSIKDLEIVDELKHQNEFLMRELDNKNKQINELHILLLKEKDQLVKLESNISRKQESLIKRIFRRARND